MEALLQPGLHGSTCDKRAITSRSRKIHFLSWCRTIGPEDPCTPVVPIQGHNWIIAYCVVSLKCGKMLTGICIQHTTLLGYIKQALSLHASCGLPHPKLADFNYIKIMSNTVKKYEDVPKRQEMISNDMFHFIA